MWAIAVGIFSMLLAAGPAPHEGRYFAIQVLDEATGRGVPLVELRTVHGARYYTDSSGLVAFYEPGLMGRRVFFYVESHGYEFPKDGFGFRGKALEVIEGGRAELRIKRINIAERLYRVTGAGIYRDSVLLGQPVPLEHPLLDGDVFGCDSVLNAVYRGRIYWFWGDTNRPAYPLGNFHVPGATSLLPGEGGLDPQVGVDLEYFLGEDGFAKPTAQMPGQGPTWLDGLVALRDASGRERLFARYVKVRPPMEVYQQGLVEFDPEKQEFQKVTEFPMDAPATPRGHPLKHHADGVEYVYFAHPFPWTRVRADVEDLKNPARYESFTCLEEGSRPDAPKLDRAADGTLRFGWKRGTPLLDQKNQARLIAAGKLKPGEATPGPCDVQTGAQVAPHAGSVCWNVYRQRWVMIFVQSGGTSFLGEVWYAEADRPEGPWVYARKIATHQKYSFYNPKQHPMFDQDRGRIIYFEGTYASTFSGAPFPTPWYDYNQVMYRLDLADPRLVLPVAIYELSEGDRPGRFGTAHQLGAGGQTPRVAFFACDRPAPGTVPMYQNQTEAGPVLHVVSGSEAPAERRAVAEEATKSPQPLCYVLPADIEDPPPSTVPLYEFVHQDGTTRAYSMDPSPPFPGYRCPERPIGRVWRNPSRTLPR